TQGTNNIGFNTIGNPYMIGSAILKMDGASANLPSVLYLLTPDIIMSIMSGNGLTRTNSAINCALAMCGMDSPAAAASVLSASISIQIGVITEPTTLLP